MIPREFDPEIKEWMDLPGLDPEALERDLANLRWLNRWFGSHALLRRMVFPWIAAAERSRPFRVLDLATGSADLPRLMADHAAKIGQALEIVALDASAQTLDVARRLSLDYSNIELREASLPGGTEGLGEYDLVMCSLALHHFSETDATVILAEMRALSSGRVLVTDLWRNRAAIAGIDLLTATILREPVTCNDARMSIRRAFTPGELAEMAAAAGLEGAVLRRHPPAWQSLVWKKGGGS